MQRRELDRDARSRLRVPEIRGSLVQRRDRRAIRLEVTIRIGGGQRRLAEHVERVAVLPVAAR
jgi:hypothetical protein